MPVDVALTRPFLAFPIFEAIWIGSMRQKREWMRELGMYQSIINYA
jgi:hypothetical protein